MDDEPLTPTVEENAAIARLAFTEDGRLLHRYLRRVLETVIDITEASTLLIQNGRRSLARDLMRHMAEGIEAGSGRRDSSDDPILTRSSGAVSVAGARGARRRVPESVPSPDTEPSTDSGAGTS